MSEPIIDRDRLTEDLTPAVRDAVGYRPPLRRQAWFWCFVLGGVLALLAYASVIAKLQSKDRAIGDARSDAAAARSGERALASQVRGLGGVPVVSPSPGAAGPRGERGPVGPAATTAQTVEAVRIVCASTTLCQQPVSLAKLRRAVTACFASKQCPTPKRGSRGPSGSPGPSGPAGPQLSDDQIAAGLLAYCSSHDGCRGPAGPKGDTGPKGDKGDTGAPGVGISSLECSGLGLTGASITVVWTDGRTTTVTCNATPSSGGTSP